MNRVHIRDLGGRDHSRHIEIAVGKARRAYANCLVGKADVQCVAICFAVNGNCANAKFPAGVQNAQCNFASIGNQNLTKHSYPLRAKLTQPDGEEGLPKLDGLTVGNEALYDFAGSIGFDLVHQLHGFDDADDLAFFNVIARRDECRSTRRRRAVVGTNDRRFHQVQASIRVLGWSLGRRCRRRTRWGSRGLGYPRGGRCGRTRRIVQSWRCGLLLVELESDLQIAAVQIELSNLVFLQKFNQLLQVCNILCFHWFPNSYTFVWFGPVKTTQLPKVSKTCFHSSMSALGAGVNTWPPVGVTATISSMRMPNLPAR